MTGSADTRLLLSVHVGRPRAVQTRREPVVTAIWKQRVAGRVAVRGVNLDGDDQADPSVHGGPDKAIYAYANEEVQARVVMGRTSVVSQARYPSWRGVSKTATV